MTSQQKILGLGALALGLLFTACSKDDKKDNSPAPVLTTTTVANLQADTANTGNYTLFSFADNKIIPNSDSATAKWDIGFKTTTIIVNGGVSGPGKAEAQIVTGVFNDLSAAPTTGYSTDSIGAKYALKTWYSYNATTHIITPVPGKVLVIKTPAGKYAKVEIQSYYKDAPASPDLNSVSRLYKFRYVFQANGSVNF
ncbi:HmuY family protein [Chitinophaga sp. Hz27]|uniref:HmuY family protein n=1 Tax=Chitinophaga sp. Hz27 TaxID=3347169 RepID=UPI0035D9AF3A